MIIEEELQESTTAAATAPRRPNRHRALILGAATIVAAGAALTAVAVDRDAAQTSDPADVSLGTEHAGPGLGGDPRRRDDVIRDQVARGLVPAATLSDGTQITGPAMRG